MGADSIPWQEIDAAIAEDRMVDAIRMYRQATGSGIGPAVATLDARRQALNVPATPSNVSPAAPPPVVLPGFDEQAVQAVQRFEASAFAPAGNRIAAWRNRRGEVCVLHRLDAAQVVLNLLPASGHYGHDLHGYTRSVVDLIRQLKAGGELDQADFGATPSVRDSILRRLDADPSPSFGLVRAPSRAVLYALDAARFESRYAYRGSWVTPDDWRAVVRGAVAIPALAEALDDVAPATVAAAPFLPNATQARLILDLCIADCAVRELKFDHEAQFRDWESVHGDRIPALLLDAWFAFMRMFDIGGHLRVALPPWLDLATRHSHSAALSAPGQVRFLAPRFPGLAAHLPPSADLVPLSSLLDASAGRGDWLLALSPDS